jgi:hypothetical protein
MRFALVLLLAGCAGSFTDVPKGADVLRCTEYSGQTAGPMASARADGCQCIQVGEIAGRVRVKLPTCEITMEAK